MSFKIKPLEIGDNYEFDCGDADLNEFFLKDAIPHKRELIGITYFLYEEGSNVAAAFFTVMNDAGVGRKMMDFIKYLFTYENKTGCRYLTVDAYNKPEEVLPFYESVGFSYFTESDKNNHTRTMRYNLKKYSDKLNQDLQASGRSTYSNR
jgi:hypothetical protein